MIYEPDLQDELLTDAEAVGGPEFVQLVLIDAAAAADAVCGVWDDGDEPPGRRTAWLPAAWLLVEQRRVALGLPGAVSGLARADPAR